MHSNALINKSDKFAIIIKESAHPSECTTLAPVWIALVGKQEAWRNETKVRMKEPMLSGVDARMWLLGAYPMRPGTKTAIDGVSIETLHLHAT